MSKVTRVIIMMVKIDNFHYGDIYNNIDDDDDVDNDENNGEHRDDVDGNSSEC